MAGLLADDDGFERSRTYELARSVHDTEAQKRFPGPAEDHHSAINVVLAGVPGLCAFLR